MPTFPTSSLQIFADPTAGEFAADREADAERLAREQPAAWARLLEVMSEAFPEQNAADNRIRRALADIRSVIQANPTGFSSFGRNEKGGWLVRCVLPVLSREAMRQAGELPPLALLAGFVAEMKPAFFQYLAQAGSSGMDPGSLDALTGPRIFIYSVRYELAKLINNSEATEKLDRFADRIKELEGEIASIIGKAHRLTTSLEVEVRTKTEEELKQIHQSRAAADDAFSGFLKDAQERTERQIESTRAAVHEDEVLRKATEIWGRKAFWNRTVFVAGLALLSVGVGVVLWKLADWGPVILREIPRKADGDIAYGIIVLLLIPVVAVGWVLRIFGRWITNTLTLGDDAALRRAMIETYLRLVGDPNAKMETSDRILIINAIFRPLPGYQQEEVAPPTISDLVSEAFKPKKP